MVIEKLPMQIMLVFLIATGMVISSHDLSMAGPVHENADLQKEEKAARKNLSKSPDDHVTITALGVVYWEMGKKRAAIKLFRKTIKIAPDYPPPYFFLGKAYFLERKNEKAITKFDIFEKKMDAFIAVDGNMKDFHVSCLYEIAGFYAASRRHDEVLGTYNKIVKLEPQDQQAHYNLAVCYYKFFHDRSRAYKELKNVIEIGGDKFLSDKAAFFVDYLRNNPDSRYAADLDFIERGD